MNTKELAMYFGNGVNSRLDFLEDALRFGSLGDETVERSMCISDFQNTTKNCAVSDIRNTGFGYEDAQNVIINYSRNIQPILSQFHQPAVEDMSRHCERMVYQTQAEIQPLDYSNNLRYSNNLNRVNACYNNIPTPVSCYSKPENFHWELLKSRTFKYSTNTGHTPFHTKVDCLKQSTTDENRIESGNTKENVSFDTNRWTEKNIVHCSDVYNEIVKPCSNEKIPVRNLKSMLVQSKNEDIVQHDVDLSSVKIDWSDEVENNRIGREVVNEILKSVEQFLNVTSVENVKSEKETKLLHENKNKNRDSVSLSCSDVSKPALSCALKEKLKLFTCSECTWVFSSKPALAKHLSKKHKVKKSWKAKTGQNVFTEKTTFQCNKCKICFNERNELKVHALIHLKEKRLKCNICGLSFKKRKDLDHHSLLHNRKPACCEICGKTFSQAGNMKIHLRIHTKEKPYTCPHCGKSYAQSGDLKTHVRVHTDDRPYLCEYCGNLFLSLSHLARHSKVHTKEKPYTCQVCGHSFAHAHHLKKHYRIHTQEKPYNCEICGKAFSRADYVKQHIRVHTKEKPYICRICGKGFSQGGSLKLHQRVHNNTR